MITLRVVPPRLLLRSGQPAANDLMALYFKALRRSWGPFDRAAAFALSGAAAVLNLGALGPSGAWTNGWNASEEALLAPGLDRRAHLSMAARKGVHRLLNPGAFPLGRNPLKNKRLFAARCRAAGLPVPDWFDPERESLEAWLDGAEAVIAKPNYASKGQGVVGFRRTEGGWLADGRPIDEAALSGKLHGAISGGGVVQRACATHPGLFDLSPGALPTLRVMTTIDEAGGIEVCDAVIRLSAGGPRAVDNFNAGNIVAGLDGEGRITRAFRRRNGDVAEVVRHPSTDAILAGRRPPDLDEAFALAARAHETFRAGFGVIGWDVGLAEDGPVLIEGNWSPGTDILALVSGRALGDTRLGALYRHHLGRLSPEVWRAARPVESEPKGPEQAAETARLAAGAR